MQIKIKIPLIVLLVKKSVELIFEFYFKKLAFSKYLTSWIWKCGKWKEWKKWLSLKTYQNFLRKEIRSYVQYITLDHSLWLCIWISKILYWASSEEFNIFSESHSLLVAFLTTRQFQLSKELKLIHK